jgi:hypothetical protein
MTGAPMPSVNEPSATESGDSAIVALREIEFDRATGKLSEGDYAELKARYTREAIVAMRRAGSAGSGRSGSTSSSLTAGAPAAAGPWAGFPSDDEIEAAVRAYRRRQAGGAACPTCGPRPEPDAIFCSTCGRYLHDRCAGCGAPVVMLDARYCVSCGSRLAA